MAEVMVTLKIMPKDVEVDMDALMGRISKVDGARLNTVDKEPIAFGLVALIASYIVGDDEGGTENLENILKDIDEIGNVEVTGVDRLL